MYANILESTLPVIESSLDVLSENSQIIENQTLVIESLNEISAKITYIFDMSMSWLGIFFGLGIVFILYKFLKGFL